MKALMRIYQTHRTSLQRSSSPRDFTRLKQTVESLWKASLGLSPEVSINEDSNFLLSGGDSLKALVFYEDLLTAAAVSSAELLEIILDGTFSHILRHIVDVERNRDKHVEPEAKRRHLEDSGMLAKRDREEIGTKAEFKVIKRASQVLDLNVGFNKNNSDLKNMKLRLSWSSDTGRCVDASPVILAHLRGKSTVFVGSHSHRMQALDLDSGSLLWERVLGNRIEASAAVSQCGTLVIVGCYDGCVYFLSASSGETRWVFRTGDAVKCCAAVDDVTGLVIVGSHDGHVYALNPKTQQCVWKRHCGGGAVFSSPCTHPSLRHLYAATLGGHLLCLNIDSGEVVWSYSKDAPFFSSPVSSDTSVVIGSADGNVCCFSVTGKVRWQFLTQEPVFSSPCLTSDHERVICGSHDGCLYCLHCSDGSLVWSFQTSGRVYSSPCVFDTPASVGTEGTLVGVASTDGTVWILDALLGQKLVSHSLPGELFSSAVVYKDSLVIGCRNDYVYCLKLSSASAVT